jgi:hypothetical protein
MYHQLFSSRYQPASAIKHPVVRNINWCRALGESEGDQNQENFSRFTIRPNGDQSLNYPGFRIKKE